MHLQTKKEKFNTAAQAKAFLETLPQGRVLEVEVSAVLSWPDPSYSFQVFQPYLGLSLNPNLLSSYPPRPRFLSEVPASRSAPPTENPPVPRVRKPRRKDRITRVALGSGRKYLSDSGILDDLYTNKVCFAEFPSSSDLPGVVDLSHWANLVASAAWDFAGKLRSQGKEVYSKIRTQKEDTAKGLLPGVWVYLLDHPPRE